MYLFTLAANRQVATLLLMLSNPTGMRQFQQLDPQRVVPGFPAIGGIREGDVNEFSPCGYSLWVQKKVPTPFRVQEPLLLRSL